MNGELREKMFENIVVEEGQKFLGWRVVPTRTTKRLE